MSDIWKDKREIWRRRTGTFCVDIIHYTHEYDGRVIHKWNVEAYLYPTHAHFHNFEGDNMFQPAASILPLHCGPSLLLWHYGKDNKITSVQVGADYAHLHDDYEGWCATREDAGKIFRDATELVEWLQAFTPDQFDPETKPQ